MHLYVWETLRTLSVSWSYMYRPYVVETDISTSLFVILLFIVIILLRRNNQNIFLFVNFKEEIEVCRNVCNIHDLYRLYEFKCITGTKVF